MPSNEYLTVCVCVCARYEYNDTLIYMDSTHRAGERVLSIALIKWRIYQGTDEQ